MKQLLMGFACLLVMTAGAQGQEAPIGGLKNIEPEYRAARKTRGIIRSIDLENRSAIISGNFYDFGPPVESASEVKMYGSDYGAFEILQEGMKVEVTYFLTPSGRSVVRLEQLHDSTVLEDA